MRSNVGFFAILLMLVGACSSGDKKESDEGKGGSTDFVINGKNIELAEKFKYDEEEAKADPNKSYYAKIGEEIVFKAVLGENDKIMEWICPSQNSGEAFSTDDSAKLTFNETGLFEVSLWTEKGEKPVTKYIYVTSGDGSSDNVASVEKIVDVESSSSNKLDKAPAPKPAPEKQPVAKVEPQKKVEIAPASKALLADAKTRDNVEAKKATPPPPPPAPAKTVPSTVAKATPPPAKVVPPPPPAPAKKEVAKPTPAPEVKKEATKVAPPPAPVAPATPVAEERMKAYEKVGANTKTKSEEEGTWIEKSSITLTPQKKCKLTEAYVYVNGSGKVKVTLRNNQTGQSASTSGGVNKGKSLLTLDELDDITLEPGSTYSLTLEPSGGVKIENAAAQNPAQRDSQKLKIDYKGNICVFDLKFRY